MRRMVTAMLALGLCVFPLLAGCSKGSDQVDQEEPATASKMKAAQADAYAGKSGAPKSGGQ
ncbi:MAG: hypothetical protein KBA64_04980 [Armatimonadetes bacterium]|jgi:hypothetical protein|nr:hypothetical protein [Armatimonadota bacterium]